MTTDSAGRRLCQVRGCTEAAPWTYTFDAEDLEIEIRLCRRHELELRDGSRRTSDVRTSTGGVA